jgi:1-acyl-sn-glycerol-3-phosphate acyltransferase
MARKILYAIMKLLMRMLTHVEVSGLENVPRSGGGIVVVNHLGRFDIPLVLVTCGREDMTGWVAEKYQKIPLIPLLVRILDGIWLDRQGANHAALRTAQEYLERGRILGVSPEGTRSQTHALIEGKQGITYVAAQTGVPIIPAGVTGPEIAGRELARLRRPRLTVRYGKPFTLPPLERATRQAALQQGTDEIMCRIAALLPPVYRGVYADHPRLKELLSVDAF